MDPGAFAIPPPRSWAGVVRAQAPAPAPAPAAPAAPAALGSGSPGHGVPLRFLARHPDVAWEVDGQLQLLIGAAKRTGDPTDVW